MEHMFGEVGIPVKPFAKYVGKAHNIREIPQVVAEAVAASVSSRPGGSYVDLSDVFHEEVSEGDGVARGFEAVCVNLGAGRVAAAREERRQRIRQVVVAGFLPVDPWAPNTDQQSVALSLFASSLFPYLGFLYHLTKSKTAPKLTLFGFYFLLAFVGARFPTCIYAKIYYGTFLSNVDWLYGGAESLLTLTNLFIVFGLQNALQKPAKFEDDDAAAEEEEEGVPLSK